MSMWWVAELPFLTGHALKDPWIWTPAPFSEKQDRGMERIKVILSAGENFKGQLGVAYKKTLKSLDDQIIVFFSSNFQVKFVIL